MGYGAVGVVVNPILKNNSYRISPYGTDWDTPFSSTDINSIGWVKMILMIYQILRVLETLRISYQMDKSL